MSGHRHPFPVPSPFAWNHRGFLRRSDFNANKQNGFPDSNLGLGPLCAQSGFADGYRLSRKHRSGHGLVIGLRGLDVSPEPTCARGIIFCAELPNQNCTASFSAGVSFLLVFTKAQSRVLDFGSDHDLSAVVGTFAAFPDVVYEKRARLRQLLGTLGNYLFGSINGVQSV